MGAIFFYGGIIGAGVTAISAIITAIALGGSRKRLVAKLYKEYYSSNTKVLE